MKPGRLMPDGGVMYVVPEFPFSPTKAISENAAVAREAAGLEELASDVGFPFSAKTMPPES